MTEISKPPAEGKGKTHTKKEHQAPVLVKAHC